jgi:hypothetical protein
VGSRDATSSNFPKPATRVGPVHPLRPNGRAVLVFIGQLVCGSSSGGVLFEASPSSLPRVT